MPTRYIRGHSQRKSVLEYVEEDRGHSTPCWIWQKATGALGYGTTWAAGRLEKAHRHYYRQYKGVIPPDTELDHLCRVPSCVNPNHLDPVSHRTNMQRGTQTKLTPEQVKEIRRLVGYGELSHRQIGDKFGVVQQQISRIARYVCWPNT